MTDVRGGSHWRRKQEHLYSSSAKSDILSATGAHQKGGVVTVLLLHRKKGFEKQRLMTGDGHTQ